MSDGLRVEHVERVVVLTLNRPDRLNAIDSVTIDQLQTALREIEEHEEVRAVVVTGEGRAFCAGADISEFTTFTDVHGARAWIASLASACERLEQLSKPTVAAVDGVAFGGGFELALACDLRIASTRARFGLPEIKLGILPAAGGTQRLPRSIPATVARHMILTGEPVDADTALRLGIVNEVVAEGEARAAAFELATHLAAGPPRALATAKWLLATGSEIPLEAGLALERETVSQLFVSEDGREGVDAFLNKRPAEFTGR